ncbi:MAG TPA: S49 family peptidase [Pseudoxanthomonas sp.]
MIRVLSAIKSRPWAITQQAMETILSIAERTNESPQAVAAKLGRPLDNTYAVENRNGVAVLPVEGPLFKRAGFFDEISGATSYARLATDFAAALNDPGINAIVLNIDSPGGDAMGVSEFADQIFAARGTKPVIAYVDGQAASAAYWIAASADEVVTSDTGMIGSIGAVLSIQDTRQREAKNGVTTHEIVSSQSPFKRVDPATEVGRSKLQALVDSLAAVFIDKVAQYRAVSAETVMQEFGQGGSFVGQAAVDAGLADRVGSFEGVIEELQARSMNRASGFAAAGGNNQEIAMSENNGAPAADSKPSKLTAAQVVEQQPEAAEAIRTEAHAKGVAEGRTAGITAERERIQSILASDEAGERAELAQHLAFGTDMPADAAVSMLAKAPKGVQADAGFARFDSAMRTEGNPKVGADAEPKEGEDQAHAALTATAKAMSLA